MARPAGYYGSWVLVPPAPSLEAIPSLRLPSSRENSIAGACSSYLAALDPAFLRPCCWTYPLPDSYNAFDVCCTTKELNPAYLLVSTDPGNLPSVRTFCQVPPILSISAPQSPSLPIRRPQSCLPSLCRSPIALPLGGGFIYIRSIPCLRAEESCGLPCVDRWHSTERGPPDRPSSSRVATKSVDNHRLGMPCQRPLEEQDDRRGSGKTQRIVFRRCTSVVLQASGGGGKARKCHLVSVIRDDFPCFPIREAASSGILGHHTLPAEALQVCHVK